MAIARDPLKHPKDEGSAGSPRGSRGRRAAVTPITPPGPADGTDGNGATQEPGAPDQSQSPARAPGQPARRSDPRMDPRVIAAVVLLVAGVVLVMLGWYGAAHTNVFTEQLPYLISGGLLGLGLIVVAGIVATGASIERETRALRVDLARAMDALSYTGRPSASAPERVLVVAGGRSYHVAGCPIPEGKGVTTMKLDEAIGAGFAACKLCGPD